MKSALFDDPSHQIVQGIIDETEARWAKAGVCPEQDAAYHVGFQYIGYLASHIRYGAQFLESDELTAARMFLHALAGGEWKTALRKRSRACAVQLTRHVRQYFPDFQAQLRMLLLDVLRGADDVRVIRSHGIVLLACALLENAKCDIRRELRRRGLPHDVTLVADAIPAARTLPPARAMIAGF